VVNVNFTDEAEFHKDSLIHKGTRR